MLYELHAGDDIEQAFAQLGVSEVLITDLEAYVCKLYMPLTELTNVADVRWRLLQNTS